MQECNDLREELDAQHRKRMESFEIQLKPIIIRDGPSKKVTSMLKKKTKKTTKKEEKRKGNKNIQLKPVIIRDGSSKKVTSMLKTSQECKIALTL